MPLRKGTSDKTLSHNIEVEKHAHPSMPTKQAVAIAYSERRESMKKDEYKENRMTHFDTTKHFSTDAQSIHQMKSAEEFISHVHSKNGMSCGGSGMMGNEPHLEHVLVLDKKAKK